MGTKITTESEKAASLLNWDEILTVSKITSIIQNMARRAMSDALMYTAELDDTKNAITKRKVIQKMETVEELYRNTKMLLSSSADGLVLPNGFDGDFGVNWELFGEWKETVKNLSTAKPRLKPTPFLDSWKKEWSNMPLPVDIFSENPQFDKVQKIC